MKLGIYLIYDITLKYFIHTYYIVRHIHIKDGVLLERHARDGHISSNFAPKPNTLHLRHGHTYQSHTYIYIASHTYIDSLTKSHAQTYTKVPSFISQLGTNNFSVNIFSFLGKYVFQEFFFDGTDLLSKVREQLHFMLVVVVINILHAVNSDNALFPRDSNVLFISI